LAELLSPGHVLRDRYVIRQMVARGGMGSIYLAEDNRLPGRLCALKEVEPELSLPEAAREQGREQFYQEASVLARLDHPNLPKVSDFFSEDSRDYLVMDYVAGPDLKVLLDDARAHGRLLPGPEVLRWIGQVMDALEYLHMQDPPVIHRDIKPSNLKLSSAGLIKVVDFGLVKQMAPDEMTVTVIQGRGTALYTPLEQYGGDSGHTDARTDIYALGATLYHLLTNHPPAEAKQRFLRPDTLRPPRELNSEISPQVEHAILWALALHPDERPPDIHALREALLSRPPRLLLPPSANVVSYLREQLRSPADQVLSIVAVALALIAIIVSLR
jgi:eukaryotic-like serine/threonine-protein kinase